MKEYIEKEAAIKDAEFIRTYLNDLHDGGWLEITNVDWRVLTDMIDDVEDIPPANVKPVVRGEWIDGGWEGDKAFQIDGRGNCWHVSKCSVCGFKKKGAKSNYCPNCGADMRKDDTDED